MKRSLLLFIITPCWLSLSSSRLSIAQEKPFGVEQEFVQKVLSGKTSPQQIPKHIPVRIFVNSFQAFAGLHASHDEYAKVLQSLYGIPEDEAELLKQLITQISEKDSENNRAFQAEICSPLLKVSHEGKSIEDFLAYLEETQTEINQELLSAFHQTLESRLTEASYRKVLDWIKEHTLPSVNHIEYDKLAMYKARNITPASYLSSYCQRNTRDR